MLVSQSECLLNTDASNFTADVYEFGEFELYIGNVCLAVGYDTVKQVKCRC